MVLVHALDEWRKAARISRGAGLISCGRGAGWLGRVLCGCV